MSFIQNLFTSRDNNANTATYVGQQDRIWWNPVTNAFYVNTANTPGGTPVTIASGSNLTLNNFTANSGTIDGNLVVTGNISPASANKIGGIFPGPGVVISNTGQLTIDSANLPISFGNFYAANNVLSIINANENMILQTEGNAEIQLVGNIGFYKPDGIPPDAANRYAFFNNDGQVAFYVPGTDLTGAVNLIGSSTGNTISPGLTGAILHITGQFGIPSRFYQDGNGDYVAWVARRWNGNVDAPTQVLANQDVLRINATAATNAGVGNVAMAQMRATALENQTTTAQGSSITFTVTPVGSPASARVDVANVTVANGITATKFTTAGNIAGGNLSLTGNIVANYVQANNFGNVGNVEIESGGTYWYFNTDNTFTGNGNVNVGNVSATNYTGLVTHSVRNAGDVTGTTLTLNVTTDDIVKCTFDNNFTVAFSSIIPGRVVTLIATNTSAGDTDIITAGISAVNMQGDNTLTVTQQTTAVITYYSTGTTTGNIFASAVYG